jgi:peptidoglycan/xylan/chitin deacetylase (PgdA/CDA1 family)
MYWSHDLHARAAVAESPGTEPVYLSFDDGPDPHWTPRVLDVLAFHGAIATFFLVGRRALAHPDIVRSIVAAGHGIGNHSFSHRHPWRMREKAARREVRDGAAALEDVCGQPAQLFRPPYGRVRRCMRDEAAACGQSLVLWHRTAIDWGPLGRAAAIARRLRRVRPGEIVLMHDCAASVNHPDQLLRVLPGWLQELEAGSMRAVRCPTPPVHALAG